MKAKDICERLKKIGNKEQAKILQRFFKTGKGEYAEGDIFVGIRVPELRKLVKEYISISFSELIKLLQSSIHEARFLAVLILIHLYKNGDASIQHQIFNIYIKNTCFINNWDLVDVSAEHIVGDYLANRSKQVIHKLAKSKLLWERRIAIMATFLYIKSGEFSETLHIAQMLINDPEDLIHKAVGWMLREIGKRNQIIEEEFLKIHYKNMPRTMLRYAIEKLSENLRKKYLQAKI